MKTKIVIIGAGRGGATLIPLFKEHNEITIVGVADTEKTALGLKIAKHLKIPVTTQPLDLITREDIDVIVDVTGNSDIRTLIGERKFRGTEVLEGKTARLFWNLIDSKEQDRNKYNVFYDVCLKLASNENIADILKNLVQKSKVIMGSINCELFGLGKYGEKLVLRASTDESLIKSKEDGDIDNYSRGEGLTGWVFKTGKYLRINNMSKFCNKTTLNKHDLETISDGPKINDKSDLEIRWLDKFKRDEYCLDTTSYASVPIKSVSNSIIGVLRVSSNKCLNVNIFVGIRTLSKLFEKKILRRCTDLPCCGRKNEEGFVCFDESIKSENALLKLLGGVEAVSTEFIISLWKQAYNTITLGKIKNLEELAMVASLALHNEKEKILKETFIELGAIYDKSRLFRFVAQKTPKLILCRGCSIFLVGEDGDHLELAKTNSLHLKERTRKNAKDKKDILTLEKGKTFLVGELKRALIIDYYGNGEIDQEKLNRSFTVYNNSENYIVEKLIDNEGIPIGLIRLYRKDNDPKFSKKEKSRLLKFIQKENCHFNNVMNTTKKNSSETGDEQAKHYMALPILDINRNLTGVLRIQRIIEGNLFTEDDIACLESIINKLTIVLEKERYLKSNLTTLRQINSKINSSTLQDDILGSILDAATHEIGFEFASIQTISETENTIRMEKSRKNPEINDALDPELWSKDISYPLNSESDKKDIHLWVLMDLEKSRVIKGWDPHFNKSIYEKYGHHNLVRAFVPIIAKSESGNPIKIGTLEAGHDIKRKELIDDTELEMLKALANQAAIAIQNAKLYSKTDEALKNKVGQLKTLNTIGEKLTLETNLTKVLDIIMERAMEFLDRNLNMGIFLFDQEKNVLTLMSSPHSRNIDTPTFSGELTISLDTKSLVVAAFNENEVKHVKDVSSHTSYLEITKKIKSELDIPLTFKGRPIGVLNAESDRINGFSKDMIDMLTSFSRQAAIAIVNANNTMELENTIQQMDDLLLITSHQMKAPLNAIKTHLEYLNLNIDKLGKKGLKPWVERMEDASHKLEFLQRNSLMATNLQEIKLKSDFQENDLTNALRLASQNLEDYAMRSKKVKIQVDIEKNLPKVKCDEDLISQIVLNLLDNAIKYTNKNEVIKLKAYSNKKIECVSIAIKNIGIPILPEDRNKIYKRFFRADNAKHMQPTGNGIGLWLAREIITLHNGKIRYTSTKLNDPPNKNTVVFSIDLPIWKGKNE